MSNDIKGGRLRIRECGECINGYMIVKKKVNANEHFLGCTNYTKDGKGCNHTISIQEFEKLYPRTDAIKQYKPADLVDRDALKYEGERIEHLNTGKAVQLAQKLKQAEVEETESIQEPKVVDPEREKQIEEQKNNEYVLKIRQKCNEYRKYITEKYSSKRNAFAYVKKGRSWYWFTIDLDHLVFSFRTLREEEFHSMTIDESHMGKILDTIDLLIRDFYKPSKAQKEATDNSQFVDNDFLLLLDAVKDHCLSYSRLIDFKENKKKISYVKKDKSFPWFWIDIQKRTFLYKPITLNDVPVEVALNKENIENILAIIDDLIQNRYGFQRKQKNLNDISDDELRKIKKSPLFIELKEFRQKLASEKKVPPYVIANDRTLVAIVLREPKSKEELLQCHGFGKKKLEQIGDEILIIVNKQH